MPVDAAFQRLRDANPVPHPAALRERPIDASVFLVATQQRSREMQTDHEPIRTKTAPTLRRRNWIPAVVAAVVVILAGGSVLLFTGDTEPGVAGGRASPVDIARTFIEARDAWDGEAARSLVADDALIDGFVATADEYLTNDGVRAGDRLEVHAARLHRNRGRPTSTGVLHIHHRERVVTSPRCRSIHRWQVLLYDRRREDPETDPHLRFQRVLTAGVGSLPCVGKGHPSTGRGGHVRLQRRRRCSSQDPRSDRALGAAHQRVRRIRGGGSRNAVTRSTKRERRDGPTKRLSRRTARSTTTRQSLAPSSDAPV